MRNGIRQENVANMIKVYHMKKSHITFLIILRISHMYTMYFFLSHLPLLSHLQFLPDTGPPAPLPLRFMGFFLVLFLIIYPVQISLPIYSGVWSLLLKFRRLPSPQRQVTPLTIHSSSVRNGALETPFTIHVKYSHLSQVLCKQPLVLSFVVQQFCCVWTSVSHWSSQTSLALQIYPHPLPWWSWALEWVGGQTDIWYVAVHSTRTCTLSSVLWPVPHKLLLQLLSTVQRNFSVEVWELPTDFTDTDIYPYNIPL